MKLTGTTLFVLVGATTVVAAEFPENMPDCGKVCGTNMIAKALEFECNVSDIACLCQDLRFGWGIHDCSVQACPGVEQANIVINWGKDLCSSAGHPIDIPTATTVGFGEPEATPSTSEVVTTMTTDDITVTTTMVTTITDSDEEPSAITTSTWTTVVTSNGAEETITGETTISGVGGVPVTTSESEDSATTITSPIVSTDTSTFETTIGTSTIVSSPTDDALTSASSTLSSLTSQAPDVTDSGAQATAAPVFGFLAAAGFAAALL
ncbi:hypothetical protein VTJ49DRAFT_599 [Mycothermus thermophilus]|uniref:CFEM domain-containing protein n=1 Tax=Humicola insolens TaxID=85995 RepID=A0ABR3VFB2_HUMIN